MSISVEKYADMIQIGARNMQNFTLLRRVGRSKLPVLIETRNGRNAWRNGCSLPNTSWRKEITKSCCASAVCAHLPSIRAIRSISRLFRLCGEFHICR